eukprot:g6950.t1
MRIGNSEAFALGNTKLFQSSPVSRSPSIQGQESQAWTSNVRAQLAALDESSKSDIKDSRSSGIANCLERRSSAVKGDSVTMNSESNERESQVQNWQPYDAGDIVRRAFNPDWGLYVPPTSRSVQSPELKPPRTPTPSPHIDPSPMPECSPSPAPSPMPECSPFPAPSPEIEIEITTDPVPSPGPSLTPSPEIEIEITTDPTAISKVKCIEQICSRDVGRRIQSLVKLTTGNLYRAANSLANLWYPGVAICTGFYIPDAQPPSAETDGPPGAAQLAAGLVESGVSVRLITDSFCIKAAQAAIDGTHCSLLSKVEDFRHIKNLEVSHFISIERVGPSKNGRSYNMRGLDVTPSSPAIHELYESGDWTKIAIGDGGNEIGMGSIPETVIAKSVSQGEKIACRVPCDHLIVSGVSNWGAWALMAALAVLKPEWKQTMTKYLAIDCAKEVLIQCIQDGNAVDGVTKSRDVIVDGLDWSFHEKILHEINSVLD